MKIIGYAYSSDLHCPTCAKVDAAWRLQVCNYHPHAYSLSSSPGGNRDEHGLHYNLVDANQNLIRPVFDTDENSNHPQPQMCGGCHKELK